MPLLLSREIEKLKKQILTLAALVEENVEKAMESVKKRDAKLAQQVIDEDDQVDTMEVDVEEECLKILALHQPVATDLRYVIAMLKINNDLERIGDLAVNIAEQAREISKAPAVAIPFDFSGMVVNVKKMLHGCLDAMVNLDLNCAWLILGSDDEVDARHREMYIKIQEKIVQDPKQVATYIRYLSVSRGLERIGDYATNIAQDVIYTIQGNIVRHQHSECAPPDRVE